MKEFNVTGVCVPRKHYMVDTSRKIEQIITLIDKEKYFTINRARQYGKTTTLDTLNNRLHERYNIIWTSFEGMSDKSFANDVAFMKNFIKKVGKEFKFTRIPEESRKKWLDISDFMEDEYDDAFDYLGEKITVLCEESDREILLFIDEIDKSTDNQVFLHFLGMLRNKYLFREMERDKTFKSVILAGVYDIKNLKIKIRPDEERKYNSPWNVAVDFNIDMSFSPEEIATMLESYEKDYHTDMDIKAISEELYFYTSGYPYLVSWLCKWVDEEGEKCWTVENITNAVKAFTKTRGTLLDDLIKNVENYPEIRGTIFDILYDGKRYSYHLAVPVIQLGTVLGIWKEEQGYVKIANVIFEKYLYDYSAGMMEMDTRICTPPNSQFIEQGKLNVKQVLLKFQELMKAEYRKENEKFVENNGRLLFLCFLKPIINGKGFYYVEPETRNNERMDIVVTYGNEEHIIELKIWHGNQYRKDGIKQLEGYMDSRNAKTGYLLSFSFLKGKKYISGMVDEKETNKEIFEVIV